MKTKVLVTGGCGFIGREVVKQLLEKNYCVRVVDDFSNSRPIKKDSSLEVIRFDLCKNQGIDRIFKDIDYCLHLAARVGGIKFTSSSQGEILHDNLLINVNTIAASAAAKIKKIIYASTAIVYDRLTKVPFKEVPIDSLPLPRSNYGFSKMVGERLCQTFNQEKGLNYTIARMFNVYGINHNTLLKEKLHVIPDLIRKISDHKNKLKLYGGGAQKRTFVHVWDAARALISMMENTKANNEIFNVASEESFCILDLARMIWKLLKREGYFHMESIPVLSEDLKEASADVSKIKKFIGWKAKRTMRESLPEIVEWYRKVYSLE